MRHVGVMVGAQVALNIGVSQVVPVLPIFAQELGLGATGIGLLLSAPSAARLACNIPLGRLCDTVGRLPLMRYGLWRLLHSTLPQACSQEVSATSRSEC